MKNIGFQTSIYNFLYLPIFFLMCMLVTACEESNVGVEKPAMIYFQATDVFAQGYIKGYNMVDAERNKPFAIEDYEVSSDMVDFVAYYTLSDGFSLASPHDTLLRSLTNYSEYISDQSSANKTQFKLLSSDTAGYSNISQESDLIKIFNNSTASISAVTNIKKGHYFAFRTDEGNYGVAYITYAAMSESKDKGYINLIGKLWRN